MPGTNNHSGFTLIEIMVVIGLLVVIVLGLTAMFEETQRAFQAGMAQTDQMEGGRMFNDMNQRELKQVTPSYLTNGLNFYARIVNSGPLLQTLPGNSVPRTNVLDDLFYMTKVNQTWTGIGYFVRTNMWDGSLVQPVGTLYRFETNMSVSQYEGTPWRAFQTYLMATNPANISKILDGVVEFRVRCYDTNGALLTGYSVVSNNYVTISNASELLAPQEMSYYAFSNNIVPAYVEVQLGVLEPAILRQYNSIPVTAPASRSNYLAAHAGNVQIFRQRTSVRNVDPLAYITNYTSSPF